MYSLLKGIQCVHIEWVDASINHGQLEAFAGFTVVAGRDLSGRVVEQTLHKAHTPLIIYKVANLIYIPFCLYWVT